jgi:ABC-type lipoprotein release transport system permease subunit
VSESAAPTPPAPFSRFERMLAMRYLRPRRKEGFISVIAGFSFAGILLGVAALIIVMSVMNGFRKELISKILGISGHVFVQAMDTPLTDFEDLARRFEQIKGVQHAIPVINGQALISSPFSSSGALVRGSARSPRTSAQERWKVSTAGRASPSASAWLTSWACASATRSRCSRPTVRQAHSARRRGGRSTTSWPSS